MLGNCSIVIKFLLSSWNIIYYEMSTASKDILIEPSKFDKLPTHDYNHKFI